MLLLEVVGIALPSFAKKLVVEKILSVSCKFFSLLPAFENLRGKGRIEYPTRKAFAVVC